MLKKGYYQDEFAVHLAAGKLFTSLQNMVEIFGFIKIFMGKPNKRKQT